MLYCDVWYCTWYHSKASTERAYKMTPCLPNKVLVGQLDAPKLCTTVRFMKRLYRTSEQLQKTCITLQTIVYTVVVSYVIYVKCPHRFLHNINTHGGIWYFLMYTPSPWHGFPHAHLQNFNPIHAELRETRGNRQTDRQTDRQSDRQTYRQSDRQTDRQTDRHKLLYSIEVGSI